MNKKYRIITCLLMLLGVPLEVQSVWADTLVRVKPLVEVLQQISYSAPADVVNEQHVLLSTELAGVLAALHVQVGDSVLKGQEIAALECQDYRLSQAQAKQGVSALASQVTLAQQQFKRTRTLQKSGSASIELLNQRQTELSALTAQLKGQKIQVQQAQRNTNRCIIKAPFGGVVTQVMTAQGAYLPVGASLVKLLNVQQAEVSARLLPKQVLSLQAGAKAYLKVADDKYPVSVRATIPLINQAARTQEVRLNFTNNTALSGASGELVWQSSLSSIPPEYLVRRDGSLGVMLAEDGIAKFIVLANAKEGQTVELDTSAESRLSSTPENNVMLIVQGQHVLEEGDKIEVEVVGISNDSKDEVKADAGTPAQ